MIPKEERKKWLQWIIDLIQMDLQSVRKWQKEKLLLEASYFCGKHFYSPDNSIDFERYEEFASPEEKSPKFDLNKLQTVLMEWLKEIEIVAAKGDSPELPSKSFLRSFKHPYPLQRSKEVKSWKRNFEVINEPINPDDYTNVAIINFIKLIDGIGTDSVKKCKGCNRYFVNVTQMEKIYCTPSCASRSIVKEKRDELKEKHPEKYKAYLRKQNDYSKKRYERLNKEKTGFRNLKIGRRERKVKSGDL